MSAQSLFLAVALAAGVALSIQTSVNARLGTVLGSPVFASLLSFVVGTAALALVSLATGARPRPGTLGLVPWWAWTGGLLGAWFVYAAVQVTPRIGPALFLGLVVAGQMAGAIALEHFGALGLARHPATPLRMLGAALLVAGVVLVRRG